MRRALFAAAGLVALAGVAWLALPALINVEQFRGLLKAQLEKQLARPVDFGAMQLRVWPLSIELGDLTIGEDPDFKSQRPFLAAKAFFVRVEARPLLSQQIVVDSIEIRDPALELIQQGDRWNYTSIGQASSSSEPSAVKLNEAIVRNGTLALTRNGQRQVYDRIDLDLAGIAPNQPFRIKLATGLGLAFTGQGNPLQGKLTARHVAIPAEYKLADHITGESDITSQGNRFQAQGKARLEKLGLVADFKGEHDTDANTTRIDRTRLTLGESAIVISGAPMAALDVQVEKLTFPDTVKAAQTLNVKLPAGLTAKGLARGNIKIRGGEYQGRLQATDLELAGPSLKQPVRTSAVTIDFTPTQLRTNPFTIETAGTKLDLAATVDNYQASTPRLNATVKTANADVADLVRVARAYGALDEDIPVKGNVTLNLQATGSPQNLQISGRLQSPALQYQDFAFTNLETTLAQTKGVLQLDPFNANLYGGRHTGAITIQPDKRIHLRSKIQNAEANDIVSAFTPLKKAIYGRFSADADLDVTPGANLTQSLQGAVKLSLADGKLMGFSLLNEVAGLAKFLKWAKRPDAFTNFLQLTGTLNLNNGTASSDDLRIQLDQAVATTTGAVNLNDQTLRMKIATVLGKSLSEEVGGTRIGGMLNTAFTNRLGELVIPTLVTGTFQKPRFAPDPETIARNKLQKFEPEKAKEQVKQIFDIFKKKK